LKELVSEIINPEMLHSIEGLELTAKMIVEGFFSGSNQSKRIGFGHEFSQYRSYQPGDDLRLMDWKMYARSERYYIRQSEVETNINIKLIIDASNSMLHSEGKATKMDYAKILAASLAYIAKRQGDNYGLLWANDKEVKTFYSQQNQLYFQRFLYHLLQIKVDGGWLKEYKNMGRFYDPQKRELIIFVTDLYDHDNDLIDFAKNLKNSRNEVVVFHIVSGNELDLSLLEPGLYEDLETGEQVRVDPSNFKNTYSELIYKALEKSRDTLVQADIGYEIFRTDKPVDKSLADFIQKRNQLL